MNSKLLLISCLTLNLFASNAQTKNIPFQEIVAGKGVFFGAEIDNATSTITMTIAGPDDRWFGVGFGSGMANADVLLYTSGKSTATHTLAPTDYKLSAQSLGGVNADAQQDWNIVSSTENAGVRTIVATRLFNTGDANDAIINFSATTINIIWAKHSTADHTMNYHGSPNRGVKNFTWVDPSAGLGDIESPFLISSTGESVLITNKGGSSFSYRLCDMQGREVLQSDMITEETHTIAANELVGSFVLVVNSSEGAISKVIRF